MNQPNYQKELEKILSRIRCQSQGVAMSDASEGMAGQVQSASGTSVNQSRSELGGLADLFQSASGALANPPRLLLHSCCAPCSSYCLEYLCATFAITVFYYNPNISVAEEYCHRVEEQKRLITTYNREGRGYPIEVIEGDYRPEVFFEAVRGFEHCPEGGERCGKCFELRLGETARRAAEGGYDFFATTLTISPLKNARLINEIGQGLSAKYGVPWLPSDFKKKDGYKRSIELSAEYGLYRQDYCGCAFSLAEREQRNLRSKWSSGI